MRIAGKQTPWWWLAIAAGIVVVVVVAVTLSGSASDRTPRVGLPDASTGPSDSPAVVASTEGENPAKSGTTPTAGSGQEQPAGTDDDASSPNDGSSDGADDGAPKPTKGYVYVKFWNDTTKNDPQNAEVVVEAASWKPRESLDADTAKVGPLTLGKTLELSVYPDGRSGKRIVVSIVVSAPMSGNERDSIHVELRDTEVRVLGNPVVGFEVTTPRD